MAQSVRNTQTMVNFVVGISMAPPMIDTSMVPEVPARLYALFDYGLTVYTQNSAILIFILLNRNNKNLLS